MARQNQALFALNRGEISLLAMSRVDIEHLRLASQSQINYLPRVLGPMMLRPGTGFIGSVYNNAPTKILPFVAAFSDTALLEFTANLMRVWINDGLLTFPNVAAIVPPFSAWTLSSTGTATAAKTATSLTFSGMNTGSSASGYVPLVINPGDINKQHAVQFTVQNGPVLFQIGTTSTGQEVFGVETLDTGTYCMAFVPGATTVYLQFSTVALADNANTTTQSIPTFAQQVQVQNISIQPPGVFSMATPWGSSTIGVPSSVPSSLRITQSGDVVFVAANGVPQYQINRYSPQSWAICPYRSVKGPMAAVPRNASISLTAGALTGNTTLTASAPLFSNSDVGTLFRLFSNGQLVSQSLSFANTFTDPIEVSGVSIISQYINSTTVHNVPTTDRDFTLTITGTWAGTITLERSFQSSTTGFSSYQTYTSNQAAITITDYLENELVWYRVGFAAGGFTSGTAVVTLSYGGGGSYGVAHVTSLSSSTVANVEVLVPLGGTAPVNDWLQSEWNTNNGFPTAAQLHEGRLWWSGADRWWGSVSDDYTNFDYDATGDSAPIDRSIGQGPIANINWMVSIDHLVAGADTSIITALSDAIESPLTPANFLLRRSVTNGAFPIQACPVDQRIVYVDQSGRKLYELIYDIRLYNYKPTDLTRLNPDIGIPGFVDMAVQRQPDTRILLPRTDGIMVDMVYDSDDNVEAFWRIALGGGGIIESVAVLPGPLEDQVYVVVNRMINGTAVRYIEKFARIDECQGAAISKCVDCHLVYQGLPANVLAGFTHLIGQTVAIWGAAKNAFSGDGSSPVDFGDLGTAVVSNTGTVTIPNNIYVTTAVVGVPYQAEFISAKLAYASQLGSALNQVKRIDHIGFTLTATHCQGVRYGRFTPNDAQNTKSGIFTLPPVLDDLPQVEYGAIVDQTTVYTQYDAKQIEFECDHDSDVRLYIQSASPRPATINGITFQIESSN